MDSLYQSYIEFLPKEPVLKKYGTIENAFSVENKASQMLSPIHYDENRTEIIPLWKEYQLSIETLQNHYPELGLKPRDLFNQPKEGYIFTGKMDVNYIYIHFDVNDGYIDYFQLGIDISMKETKAFVEYLLKIANQFNFVILGSDLKIFEPTIQEIDKYFRNSPAYKFIKDEVKFLADVKARLLKTDVPVIQLKDN